MTTAQDRGWGPGWPNCQTAKWIRREAAGITWVVRKEIADLFAAFAEEWHRTVEPLDPAQCWSAVCRAIRGTDTPSNHSWALAKDFNSALHPWRAKGTFTAAQVRAIRAILAKPWFRNFRWGGDWHGTSVDEMHIEYVGTLAQADEDTRLLHEQEDDMPLTDADLDKMDARTEKIVRQVLNEGTQIANPAPGKPTHWGGGMWRKVFSAMYGKVDETADAVKRIEKALAAQPPATGGSSDLSGEWEATFNRKA